MGARAVRVEGLGYLDALTALCRRVRLAAPAACAWEGADVQWWWRTARPTDLDGQVVFLDGDGVPEAAVVRTAFPTFCQLDVIVAADARTVDGDEVADVAVERATSWTQGPLEAFADVGTPAARALAGAGFAGSGEVVDAWLDPTRRPRAAALPEGFELHARVDDAVREHHLVRRNASDVATRLAECSLYDAALDLFVTSPTGEVCAYGLFWADPATGVGLVEPMRTEEGFEHRGIASFVLATGLELLVSRGCTRLKVSSDGPLYAKAGFEAGARRSALRRHDAD